MYVKEPFDKYLSDDRYDSVLMVIMNSSENGLFNINNARLS